jgi:regulatory protein
MSKIALEKRLIQKGESAEAAQETVARLEKSGYINDSEYAASIVQHYITKGFGLAKIKNELYRRGIPRDMWDEALGEIDGMEDAALEFLQKRLQGSDDKDELRRAADALCRRGFSYEEARQAVRQYLENIGEAENL